MKQEGGGARRVDLWGGSPMAVPWSVWVEMVIQNRYGIRGKRPGLDLQSNWTDL